MTERSLFIWNSPVTSAGRRAKAAQLQGIGCTEVLMKGFGDDGVAWIEGENLPSWARPQWSDTYYADFAPLKYTLWGYPHPRDSDIASCVRALRARWSDRVVLNPEAEWRWQNSNVNPWHSLAEANMAAQDWVRRLKAQCLAQLGRVPSFWISGCPSWADFPYEGFVAECDGSLPEHYFFEADMARGEDMVEAHIRRAGTQKPCTPVLTCCREYDDDGVVGLATLALRDYPHPAGFCGWEAGNSAFQADAMRRAYLLLPEDIVEKDDVTPETDQSVRAYIDAKGRAVLEITYGGQATAVLGFNVQDAGISVRNAAGEVYDDSMQSNVFMPWRKR